MTLRPALAALLLLAAAPAIPRAQQPAPAQVAPEALPAGTYVIDSKETLVRYATGHMGFTEFWGTFPGATGTMTLDPRAIETARFEVTVPVASIETTNHELNGELVSDEFFDAARFPTLRFVSTSVSRTGPRTARVTGDLTLHGITRPATLNVTFHGAGLNPFKKQVLTVGFDGEGVVKRSDYGMGKYAPLVSDETKIVFSVAWELAK